MPFYLLNNQSIFYEISERNSNLFYKNNYKLDVSLFTKMGAQKEYTKTLELLLSIFYFYFFRLTSTNFKSTILSSGVSKKEQVHRSFLNLLKNNQQLSSVFSFHLQNFVFLVNMINTNFYKNILKYGVKKNRFLKNSHTLSFIKTAHFAPHNYNKINTTAALRTEYQIRFFGFSNKIFFPL